MIFFSPSVKNPWAFKDDIMLKVPYWTFHVVVNVYVLERRSVNHVEHVE